MKGKASRVVRLGDESFHVELQGADQVRIAELEASFQVAVGADGACLVSDGTRRWRVLVTTGPGGQQAFVEGDVYDFRVESAGRRRRSGSHGPEALAAPMPARVVKVLVEPGQRVRRGDLVVTLEAMKMELPIRAPRDGRVGEVACREGDLVQPGATLLEIV